MPDLMQNLIDPNAQPTDPSQARQAQILAMAGRNMSAAQVQEVRVVGQVEIDGSDAELWQRTCRDMGKFAVFLEATGMQKPADPTNN